MPITKALLFLSMLPFTLALDLVLFAFTQTCPSCGSFPQFLAKDIAFSFPVIAGLSVWTGHIAQQVHRRFSHSQPTTHLPAQSGNPQQKI